MIALIFLALAIVAYAISQLQQQDKLKWQEEKYYSFWERNSWMRKYKRGKNQVFAHDFEFAPNNWYYRFFKIKYKERFPLSATLLVCITDGYHFTQFWMFNFLALSLTFAHGWNWWLFGGLMIGIRLVHWAARKLFSK